MATSAAGLCTEARADPGADNASDNALRIARRLHDGRLVASLLSRRALSPGATEGEIREVVAAYEDMADPEAAAAFLRRRVDAFPDERTPLLLLAEVCARSDQGDEAITRYERARQRFGLTPAEGLQFARLLAKKGNLARALAVVKDAVADDLDPSPDALRSLGALAWEVDDVDAAFDAYAKLHARGADTAEDLARLISLAQDMGRARDALAYAAVRYERDRRPEDLLSLGEVQEAEEDWVGLARTMARAARFEDRFAGKVTYWRLQAASRFHDGDLGRTRAAYRALLAIDPGSKYAKAGLLWNAVDRRDTGALTQYTAAFSIDAEKSRELRAPMAAALAFLGRTREAARFFALELRDSPNDSTPLLDFADAMEQSGDTGRADQMRRAALARLGPSPLAGEKSSPLSEATVRLLERRAAFARAYEGVDAADRWIRALVARAPTQSVREFAANSYLADGRIEDARGVLERPPLSPAAPRTTALLDADTDSGESDLEEHALTLKLTHTRGGADDESALFELLDRDRDSEAGRRIARMLSEEDTPGDTDAVRSPLGELAFRHAPMAASGASYVRLGDLETDQVGLSMAHDAGSLRFEYEGSGRLLSSRGSDVSLPQPRREGDLSVRALRLEPRGSTELELAVNVQETQAAPRARVVRQDRWPQGTSLVFLAEANGLVENETATLRLGALRDRLRETFTANFAAPLYSSLEVEGFEDHGRDYGFWGAGVRADAEFGVRILKERPEASIGIAGSGLSRSNPVPLPPGAKAFQSPASDPLPPPYYAVSLVVHLSHGDWSDRQHRDYSDFPRFGCDGSLGVVGGTTTLTGLVACAAKVKVSRRTFASGGGIYEFGVVGLSQLAYGSLFLSLNQMF